jgi:hypothetical protein
VQGQGFGVHDLGVRGSGPDFRVLDKRSRVQGFQASVSFFGFWGKNEAFGVQNLGFRWLDAEFIVFGSWFMVESLGLRIYCLGFRVSFLWFSG